MLLKYENVWAKLGKTNIWESKKQKLLGLEIDRSLSFDKHITSLYRKAGKKLSALARLSNFMNRSLVIVLSFGFCKRSLQIVYKENISSSEDLLKRAKSFTIHQMNIQSLAIELFEVKGNLSNSIIYDIFQTRKMNSDLRAQTNFASNCVHTNKFSLNSRRYFAWNIVSLEIKNSGSVEIFKTKIRNWEPNDCYCYLRETYINNLGFVNVILIPFFIVKNCIYIYLKYFLIY